MSTSDAGTHIQCDGADCQAIALLPVALRHQLLPSAWAAAGAEGWLFISGSSVARHFCPRCASAQLDYIADNTNGA